MLENTALATLEVDELPSGEQADEIVSSLGQNWSAPSRQIIDGVETICLALGQPHPVDLSKLPRGKVTHLQILAGVNNSLLELTNLPSDSVLSLQIPDVKANERLETLRLTDCHGQVRVVSTVQGMNLMCTEAHKTPTSSTETAVSPLEIPEQEARSVVIEPNATLSIKESPGESVLILRGGQLYLETALKHLVLAGRGSIHRNNGGPVEDLEVYGDSRLDFGAHLPTIVRLRASPCRSGVDPADKSLTKVVLRVPSSRRNEAEHSLSLNHIENLHLTSTPWPLSLQRIMSITGSILEGPTRLSLREQATVSQTEFRPHPERKNLTPLVSADAGCHLIGVTGSVSLGQVPEIHIAAASQGLTIDLDPSGQDLESPWRGSMMTNVILPTGLPGRRILAKLEDAYQITPNVANLPGLDQTIVAKVTGRRATSYNKSADGQRTLFEDAEFLRELARICREKGAPGSVTTTVAWCAYRLRSIKTQGVERVALGLYRWLGYGERPLPAFILWIVLAVGLAGPVLAAGGSKFDPSGTGHLFIEAGRLALGPLAGLLRGGNLSGGDIAEIAARAITSIPLITGSIALRNYVKSGGS